MSGIRIRIPIRSPCSPNDNKVVTGRLVFSFPDDSTRLSSNMAVLPGKLPHFNRHRNTLTKFPSPKQFPHAAGAASPSFLSLHLLPAKFAWDCHWPPPRPAPPPFLVGNQHRSCYSERRISTN